MTKGLLEIVTPEQVERYFKYLQPEPSTGCLLWTAARTPQGYGRYNIGNRILGTRFYCTAHRLAWELEFGGIPPEIQVLHKCDTPPCCNPDHLWLGDNEANVEDKAKKWRGRKGDLPFGVRRCGDRFNASLRFRRKVMSLGVYNTVEEAHAVAVAKKKILYGLA